MAKAQKVISRGNGILHNGANGALNAVSDFADQANSALHAHYDQAAERFSDASAYAIKRGRKAAHVAQGYATEVVPGTSRFVRNNPLLSLGLAIGVGLFLGLSARR